MRSQITTTLLAIGIALVFSGCIHSRQQSSEPASAALDGIFSLDTQGLPEAQAQEVVELQDGEKYDLTIREVSQMVDGKLIKRLAYNGSIPGPLIKVKEGSTVFINLKNEGDVEALLHSHGLRLENPFDGTHAVQDPIPIGESFEYKLYFPDIGVYWYHPHHREDYAQDMGLYGNYIVESNDSNYWSPVNREVTLMVDDVLFDGDQIAPYYKDKVDHAIMGRYGNTLLVNGTTDYELQVNKGEVVRFLITNVANVRPFNLSLPGAELKLVGSDVGKYEREEYIDDLIISPSERYIVEAYFPSTGSFDLIHKTPDTEKAISKVIVSDQEASDSYVDSFKVLRTNQDVISDIDNFRQYFAGEPDKIIDFSVELAMDMSQFPCHRMSDGTMMGNCDDLMNMDDGAMKMDEGTMAMDDGAMKMDEGTMEMGEGTMKMDNGDIKMDEGTMAMDEDTMKMDEDDAMMKSMMNMPCHQMADGTMMGDCGDEKEMAMDSEMMNDEPASEEKIEWEDDMGEINAKSTNKTVKWQMIDKETGEINTDIDWKFKVGDVVKIRLFNDPKSDHPMQHPVHIHGQRFLVLNTNGVANENLVWKDTTLLQRGDVVDILLEITNPGTWLMHCHISEHIESGMKLQILVTE